MKIVGRKLWNVKKRKMFLLERKCIIKGSKREISIRESKVLLFFFKFKLIIILKKLTNSIEQKERSLESFRAFENFTNNSYCVNIVQDLCNTRYINYTSFEDLFHARRKF